MRNEAAHIGALVGSMLGQSRLPDLWAVVDDGSDDATVEMVRSLVGGATFVRVFTVPSSGPEDDNESRLRSASEARAFNWALTQVDVEQFTHIAKVDGDIELPCDWFAGLLAEFARRPGLGIAGGLFAERAADGWRPVSIPAYHVPGALKVYARSCLESIGGIREHLGWDTIDETTARMQGFETRSFPEIVARHLRPWGTVGGTLRGRSRYGACAYAARYPAAWVALRSLKVATMPPRGLSGAAFLLGYARAAVRKAHRVEDEDFRRFVRTELRQRITRKFRFRSIVPTSKRV